VGSRTQLESVFHNLLGNSKDAFAASGRPGRVISIRAEASERGDSVRIKYVDNAGGIPPEVMTHLFEPFFSTKGGEGTGLGLAISRQIISHHAGEIRCESSEGNTTFRIMLPASGKRSHRRAQPAQAAPSVSPA